MFHGSIIKTHHLRKLDCFLLKRRMFSVLRVKGTSIVYLREGKAKKKLPWFQSFPWYDKSNMQVKYVDFSNSATQSPRGGGGGAAGLAKVLPFTRPNFANFVTLY